MGGAILAVTVVLLGVDVGWQPAEDGGLEYIIQIEPHLLDRLRAGEDLGSGIPAGLMKDVRSYRITVGTGRLPRKGLPERRPEFDAPPRPGEQGSGLGSFPNPFNPSGQGVDSPSDTKPSPKPDNVNPTSPPKPLEAQSAVYAQELESDQSSKSESPAGGSVSVPEEAKPWPLFWIVACTACGLFAALVYMFWIHWEIRSRYRALLAECPVPAARGRSE